MKKVLNHFQEWYGLYIFFFVLILLCLFFGSLCSHDDYLEENRDYILTINDTSYYCIDIDFNYPLLFEIPKEYIRLQLDSNTYSHIPKDSYYTVETVIVGPQPTYFEWLIGDYDE